MITKCLKSITEFDYADFKFYAENEFIDDWNLALKHFEESKF